MRKRSMEIVRSLAHAVVKHVRMHDKRLVRILENQKIRCFQSICYIKIVLIKIIFKKKYHKLTLSSFSSLDSLVFKIMQSKY